MVKKVSIWLTLEPLLSFESLHLAAISKKLGKSHVTVGKQLSAFERLGIVKSEKKGRQVFYKLREDPLIVDYLTIVEKERLIRKCRSDLVLKELVNKLHSLKNPIILFGSAVDSMKKARDVDLLIIGNVKKEVFSELGKKLNLKFHLIVVKDEKEISEALKLEVKKKHLIIQGSERWIKWLIS